jgi:hypothetical protein
VTSAFHLTGMAQAISPLCRTPREGYHVDLTLMVALNARRSVMPFRRGGLGAVATLGVACATAFCPQAAHAQVKLEYKFPEGKKLTYKTTSRVRQLVTLMNNMELESVKKETKEWSRSVGQRRGDFTLPVEEKVQNLQVDYALPGGIKLTLDSSSPSAKIDNAQLAVLGEVFKLESTIAYVVLLDKETKVKAIEGVDKLREKVEKVNDAIAREEFQNEINADRLKTRFEQELHSLPDVVVRTAEPWERTEILDINGKTFTIRKKYEYRGTEKKGDKVLDKISSKVLEVKYDQDPKGTLPLKVVKNDLKVESSEGTILFDREQGHLVNATERIRIKGQIGYSGAGVEQSGEFNLTIDTNTQLQFAAK